MLAAYVRVSSEESKLKGYSIQNQIDEAIKKVGTSDVIIYKDEALSGEFLERPGLEKLRHDIREGLIDTLVVYDPDRLSRKLMDQLILDDEFRKNGVEMVFVNGEYQNTPEGKLFYSMRGAISEFEKAKIRQRTMGGRKLKAKKGKVVKNDHNYGYDFKDGKLLVKEDEAQIVKMIYDMFLKKNKGINGIAKYLTESGIPTKTGKKVWHRQVVRQILMSEIYTGKKIQNRYNTEGMLANKYKKDKSDKVAMQLRPVEEWLYVECPAIITQDEFTQSITLLEQSRRRYAKKAKREYLLSGLLRCNSCGNTLTGRVANNWGAKIRQYTDIKNTAGAKNKGCGLHVKADDIEKDVWDYFINIMNNPEQIASYSETNETSFEERELERLEKEIEKTKKGRKRMYSLLAISEDDELDMKEIKSEILGLQEKEKELKVKYNQYKEEIKVLSNNEVNKSLLNEVIDIYLFKKEKELSFEEKQNLLRMIIKEIRVIDKDNIDIYTF